MWTQYKLIVDGTEMLVTDDEQRAYEAAFQWKSKALMGVELHRVNVTVLDIEGVMPALDEDVF